jgi:cytochrome c-type biogenesis protein CcmH/NrfG
VVAALPIFFVAIVLSAGAALFVLRAYRRAEGGDKVRAAPAFITAALLAALAFAIYLYAGRPGLEGAPYAMRLEALKQRSLETLTSEEVLAILADRARAAPEEAEPHLYSGQIFLGAGDAEQAARAFDAALRRDPTSAPALLGLGRSLVQMNDGRVTAEAARALEQAAAADPADPAPWLYLAMAAMQEDRAADAGRLWSEAQRRMAPDDPRQEMAARMIEELRP